MSEIYLGYPPDPIVSWCKEKYGNRGTPYVYFGTSGSDHVHKFEVTSLAHDNYGNSSAVCLVDNQPISYAEFTYLSSDGGCTCQSIGDSEFYSCEKLQLIHMPALAKVDCVYTGAFSQCYNLSSVTLEKCKLAGHGCFSGCTSLVSVALPECQELGATCFSECAHLRELHLPQVTRIGSVAFAESGLASLELNSIAVAEVLENSSEWGIPVGCVVTCKDGTLTVS